MRSYYTYEVRLAPGCYRGPEAPLVSRHRTLRAAVARARRSDRYQVERSDSSRCLWRPPARKTPGLGPGLYGTGPQRGEPTLAQCVADAARVEASWETT